MGEAKRPRSAKPAQKKGERLSLHVHGLRCKTCGDTIVVPGPPGMPGERLTSYLERKTRSVKPAHETRETDLSTLRFFHKTRSAQPVHETGEISEADLSALRLFLTTHDKAQYGCVVEYVTYMAVSGSLALKDEV